MFGCGTEENLKFYQNKSQVHGFIVRTKKTKTDKLKLLSIFANSIQFKGLRKRQPFNFI